MMQETELSITFCCFYVDRASQFNILSQRNVAWIFKCFDNENRLCVLVMKVRLHTFRLLRKEIV